MSVIGPSCSLPSENAPGCGCRADRHVGGKAAGAAALTAIAAATCTACCVLPFMLPAVVLALAGGSIAVLDHAHAWVTEFAMAMTVFAWLWIAWQARTTNRRIARSTLAIMIAATLLTAAAAARPVIEPSVFHALGIVKLRKAG